MPRSANPEEPRPETGRGSPDARITRRGALVGAGLLGVGAGLDRAVSATVAGSDLTPASQPPVPFHGKRQAGVGTPPQAHLNFAAFDVASGSAAKLRELLVRWTDAAAVLTAGKQYLPAAETAQRVPSDTGEALGLAPARLTLTFGVGPGLFESQGKDRFGLAHLKPAVLESLPPFPGELLDQAHSGGDLCVQACADDPQVAFHAVHVLSRIAAPDAVLRWVQVGFRYPPARSAGGRNPRNLLGFKDGTENVRSDDRSSMDEFVWVGGRDQPTWMRDGTYLVARRIELVLSTWDPLTLEQQERTIGRHKQSGAPLGGRNEYDPVDLQATDRQGKLVIPGSAHIRVASASVNGGQRILRRSYSYSGGSTASAAGAGGRQLDGGLFFIAFVRDPAQQFIPIQRRLATQDALTAFTVHTASAVFACPPGVPRRGYIGQGLFE